MQYKKTRLRTEGLDFSKNYIYLRGSEFVLETAVDLPFFKSAKELVLASDWRECLHVRLPPLISDDDYTILSHEFVHIFEEGCPRLIHNSIYDSRKNCSERLLMIQ